MALSKKIWIRAKLVSHFERPNHRERREEEKREEEEEEEKEKKKRREEETEIKKGMDSMIFGMDITWKVRIIWILYGLVWITWISCNGYMFVGCGL